MNLVVSDTGPLLHLHQVAATSLLAHLGQVQVTPTVWRELQRHAPSFLTGTPPAWLNQSQLSARALAQAAQWVNAQVLHAGEAEALAYAHEARADIFLTDDAAARTVGESLGLQVRGTLGVVLLAAASKHLDHASSSKILSDIEQHSTLWMSTKVKTAARNALGQIFEKSS